ncbi:MAG: 5-(carboxyamino)imidazole ribonucleotide synthase [Frankiaceae bacterium]|nr:5-(carboxyamino)imidazole ribonucleotide synthase [Frankiaceae bacterium]
MSDPLVVGMVGGGQLARMTHQAAIPLGLSLRVLAERADDGAALVAHDVELGSPDDLAALTRFAKGCDVVTFDHEHVPTAVLQTLEHDGVVTRPSSSALVFAQDKLAQRRRLSALGLPVPAYAEVREPADVAAFAADHGWPVVLKAVRGGYDGRGVWMVDGPLDALPGAAVPGSGVYVEQRVPLVHELAVQVARRPSGEMRAWPVVETVQRNGICVEVVAPAPRLSPGLAADAERLALRIAEELDVVGVLAVELFEAPGGLLVNELAMRPHNSGHWSIEGARTSQFEQHLRAVLDWPLGDPTPLAPVIVMANVLGGDDTDLARTLPIALAGEPSVSVHLYGKQARPGRKLGHVTAMGSDVVTVRASARRAAALLRDGREEDA